MAAIGEFVAAGQEAGAGTGKKTGTGMELELEMRNQSWDCGMCSH